MLSLKIWPLLLAVYSFSVDRNNVFLSATYIPNDLKLQLNTAGGGYVGCLISDVCLPTETCQHDNLFGRCIEGNFDGSTYLLSYAERSLLSNLKRDFYRVGLDFSKVYVQCVFRGLIMKFRLHDVNMNIVKLCGEVPFEVVESYKENHNTNARNGANSIAQKRYIREFENFDVVETPIEKLYKPKLMIDDEIQIFPEESITIYNFSRGDNSDGSPITYEDLFKDAKFASKRFARDKASRIDFNRLTKNTIWLRFSKPVNYIEAGGILQELSEIVPIRPPITQFQLGETGHVLIFFVPFETGLVASDVINMMRRIPQWTRQRRVFQHGIGMPVLTKSIASPLTADKVEHLSETGEYLGSWTTQEQGSVDTSFRKKFSHVGFVVFVVMAMLVVLAALLLFVDTLVRRRDRLSCYLAGAAGKASVGPSVAPAGLTTVGNTNLNDSIEKQRQEAVFTPPLHQKTSEIAEKQGTFRRQPISTESSETSTESTVSHLSHSTTKSSGKSFRNEVPVQMTLDVITGHLILSYMEERLLNRDRLNADWEEMNSYESEEAVLCESAGKPENAHKNREGCPVPYEQARVKLLSPDNDYINASLIYDHDPRNPVYIAAVTPLLSTVGDFWQMVWEQFSVVIVCLEPSSALTEVIENSFGVTVYGNDVVVQARYWPLQGSAVFGNFEVRLVSEHRQCSDYIVRSFYLKARDSGETRTVTQFHLLSWLEDTPSCGVKTLLEFRRKVNRSFRAKNSPAIVHCRDGSSKTGTYLLLDLVLSRIGKGVKELDVVASLEHLRDQRQGILKSKDQFELVLAAIAEEVNMMLRFTTFTS